MPIIERYGTTSEKPLLVHLPCEVFSNPYCIAGDPPIIGYGSYNYSYSVSKTGDGTPTCQITYQFWPTNPAEFWVTWEGYITTTFWGSTCENCQFSISYAYEASGVCPDTMANLVRFEFAAPSINWETDEYDLCSLTPSSNGGYDIDELVTDCGWANEAAIYVFGTFGCSVAREGASQEVTLSLSIS